MQSDLSFVYLSMKILQFLNPELQRASLVDIVGAFLHSMRILPMPPRGQHCISEFRACGCCIYRRPP